MQVEKINGARDPITPLDEGKLRGILENADVKEVHAFRLEPGMEVKVKDQIYRVGRVNSKGKKAIVHLDKK